MNLARTRFLSALALLLAFAGTAVLAPDPAHARDRYQMAQADRQSDLSDQRRQDARRQDDQAPAERPQRDLQRSGGMSAEERRALRREIHDVGREVYPVQSEPSGRPPRRR